jgi:Na+-translocating ferredoxin:NAD+ oxidoreductase RnfG subunit
MRWTLASGWCSSALAVLLAFAAPAARAAVFASEDQALHAAFPDADRIEPHAYVLNDAQAERIKQLAEADLDRKVWTVHAAHRGAELLGYAVLDVRTVRTLPEALLIVLAPDGSVRSVRVLAFHEPSEYQPNEHFLEQMDGKRLSPELHLKRDIHGIAGATLSSQSVTRGVRTALALYQVLIRDGAVAE